LETASQVLPRLVPGATDVAQAARRPIPALRRAMIWILFLEIVIGALSVGITARRATWDATQGIRHSEDLNNGWGWGQRALRYGLFRLYDDVIAHCPDGDYTLDYAPLRLAVMTTWAHWTNQHQNGAGGWRDDYAFTAPLLYFNTVMALLAAIAVFALVRLWTFRPSNLHETCVGESPYWFAKPLAAAILFWLNPALLLDAHAWPQWDIWPVPFFLFALLAASTQRWLFTGALLGVGVMLKGQLLLVVPLFILWPLFQKNWRGALGVAAAFILAITLITAPWTIGQHSMAWFKIGFTYGAAKFPDMTIGAENLAAILQRKFNLHCQDAVPGLSITIKQLLATAYVVTLILASRAAARHRAASDPRFLVAVIMPWLCFFALLTQMHERYLVWAACLSACWIAAGPAMTALHLLITATSFLIMAQYMSAARPTAWPALTRLVQLASPVLAWTVLISAALVTLASLTKSRRARAI
jgi:hypothetical protein